MPDPGFDNAAMLFRQTPDCGAQNNEQTRVPGASHIPGGLQYSALGIEALQFGIDKLQALPLRFGSGLALQH